MFRRGLLLSLVLLFCGCSEPILTQWPSQAIFNQYFRLQDVKLGMSRQEVESIMGPPPIREEGDYRRGHFTFLFYRTHNMDYEGSETVRGGYTPLVFQKDVLIGMGKRDYRRAVDRPGTDLEPDRWK
ncbi:MAG: DUF3192 domain-containing protein [Thermodesulfobacteriota bacterium]